MKAKALWHNQPNQSVIIEEPLLVGAGEVLVLSKYSLISMGTERLVSRAEVPSTLLDQMTVPYMKGDFDLPIKYGYSVVGQSEDGLHYHFMHPHQNECAIDKDVLFELPSTLPLARAALISNMETVINAIWDAGDLTNKRIAICGYGGVGALLSMTLKLHYNVDVHVQELNPWRQAKALELTHSLHQDTETYDIVFHTSASGSGLQWSLDHLNQEGSVIELSWYGQRSVELALGHAFHYKRLRIISSQVSTIPGHMTEQHDYRSRKELAVNYLNDDRYDDLITDLIPFEESPDFYNKLRTGRHGNGLIWLIQY